MMNSGRAEHNYCTEDDTQLDTEGSRTFLQFIKMGTVLHENDALAKHSITNVNSKNILIQKSKKNLKQTKGHMEWKHPTGNLRIDVLQGRDGEDKSV